ncbi:Heavy metal-associated isoprenylated plant protein 19 [Linum perenne]
MEDPNQEQEEQTLVVEYRVPMHCNACERLVAKTISKFQGVKQFTTQMHKHKVVVWAHDIDPMKLLRKLRKKTGKKAEIVEEKEDGGEEVAAAAVGGGDDENRGLCPPPLEMGLAAGFVPYQCCYYYYCHYNYSDGLFTAFSDENANACSLM